MKNLLLAIAIILVASCEKETAAPPCEIDQTGTASIENQSATDVDIWFSGVYAGKVETGKTKLVPLDAGAYILRAKARVNNNPNEWETAVAITVCEISPTVLRD